MLRLLLLSTCAALAAACGSPSGVPSQGASPVIRAFSATPAELPVDGGTVTLSWDVTGATRLTVAPGVGAVTPVTTGSLQISVGGSTRFSLSATGEGGVSQAFADVTVPATCDASGSHGGTCYVARDGRCIDYSGVSTGDAAGLPDFCDALQGTWGTAPCPTEGRVGTCSLPPATPSAGLECSPGATVLERFYGPNYSAAGAAAACAYVPGATFTSG